MVGPYRSEMHANTPFVFLTPRRTVIMKYLLSLVFVFTTTSLFLARAETVIEGVFNLLPAKSGAAASARYQQKSGAVAAPDAPSAVVYLEGSFQAPISALSITNEVRQQGFQFMPSLLPVLKGSSVRFPNSDDDYHHVFSYSKVKKFDLGRYRKDEKRDPVIVFDTAGVVKIGCEIHDHMRAVILVLDTPVFTKTDREGKYRLVINNVPDGRYVLKAWADEKNIQQQTVELKEGSKLKVDFPGK